MKISYLKPLIYFIIFIVNTFMKAQEPAVMYPDKKYTQITWLTTHNSYCAPEYGFKTFFEGGANQDRSITEQLNDGVRGFGLDFHSINEELVFRHGYGLFYTNPDAILNEFKQWLISNPDGIITFILELVDVSEGQMTDLLVEAGLWSMVYDPGRYPGTFLSLSEMVALNKRIVIFSPNYYQDTRYMYNYEVFTPYANAAWKEGQLFANAAEKEAGKQWVSEIEDLPFFMLNHSANTQYGNADPQAAFRANSILAPTAVTAYEVYERKPNFIVLDYYNYYQTAGKSPLDIVNDFNNFSVDELKISYAGFMLFGSKNWKNGSAWYASSDYTPYKEAGFFFNNNDIEGFIPLYIGTITFYTGPEFTGTSQSFTLACEDQGKFFELNSELANRVSSIKFRKSYFSAACFLPFEWITSDIGEVSADGFAEYDWRRKEFTIKGSGSDIWGTDDEFFYVYQDQSKNGAISGDFDIRAEIEILDAEHPFSKAGIMIRQNDSPDSRNVNLLVSKSYGSAMQYRLSDGGETYSIDGSPKKGSQFVKIERRGKRLRGFFWSTEEQKYKLIKELFIDIGKAHIGLAVSSHIDGSYATVKFKHVYIDKISPPDCSQGLERPKFSIDIGSPTIRGVAEYCPSTDKYTVNAGGSDIWGVSDQFHFVTNLEQISDPTKNLLNKNGYKIIAKINSLSHSDDSAKAGVMARENFDADSPHVMVVMTAKHGAALQYRLKKGGETFHIGLTNSETKTFPQWIKLEKRDENVFTGYVSKDRFNWKLVGNVNIQEPLLFGGLAVTSHNENIATTALISNFNIYDNLINCSEPISAPFTSEDIGEPITIGSAEYCSSTHKYTVKAGGSDIWGVSDEFHFVNKHMDSNQYEVIAKVESIAKTNPWAKAGVMIRVFKNANAPHVMMVMTPNYGVAMQYRLETGGNTSHIALDSPNDSFPKWVKLKKNGNWFSGYSSDDGENWTLVRTLEIPNLGDDNRVGMVATSHNPEVLTTAVFENFGIFDTSNECSQAVSYPLISQDIGSLTIPGIADYCPTSEKYTIYTGGLDIWGTSDQFHFINQYETDNEYRVTAKIESLSHSDNWAKAGVMIRSNKSANANDPHIMVVMTAKNGLAMQYRLNSGGNTFHIGLKNDSTLTFPQWVRIERLDGNIFRGLISKDGTYWTIIGTVEIPNMGLNNYVGMVATSHNENVATTAVFDKFSLDFLPSSSKGISSSGMLVREVSADLLEITLKTSFENYYDINENSQRVFTQIAVYDLTGALKLKKDVQLKTIRQIKFKIETQNLKPDIYIIKTSVNGIIETKKVFIGHKKQ